jgi:hypothetical protein
VGEALEDFTEEITGRKKDAPGVESWGDAQLSQFEEELPIS